ncbi:MAG: RAMP superfamily CRISPR-associated protein [Caldilineaceae bacterium]
MSVTLTFRLELQSDYHISTGYGLAAEADSALLRDADGVPVIRGTILTGLLRDGLWRLLQLEPLQHYRHCQTSGLTASTDLSAKPWRYCGQFDARTNQQTEECPLCSIFGSSRHAKRWQISSARPLGHEPIQSGHQALYAPEQQQIVQRVRVDPVVRRAAPNQLFSQEEGGCFTFRFKATCTTLDSQTIPESALLTAAARMVRHLGRSRRRGQGECLLIIEHVEGLSIPATQTDLLTFFEIYWLQNSREDTEQTLSLARVSDKKETKTVGTSNSPAGSRRRFRLIVRTDEPLLLVERNRAGNQYDSKTYISGATIRGALGWRSAQFAGFDWNDFENSSTPDYEDFQQIFWRGDIHFTHLYPAIYEDQVLTPAVPAPLDWVTCKLYRGHKTEGHGVFRLRDLANEQCPETGCDETLEPMGGYVILNQSLKSFQPERHSDIHIRINPQSNRVSDGDLYTYATLAAGQYFVGEIYCQTTEAWSKFCNLTDLQEDQIFTMRLGKAAKRGYGHVTAVIQPCPTADEVVKTSRATWIGMPLADRVKQPPTDAQPMNMTLLTDTILLDPWGRYMAGFADAAPLLSKALGVEVKVLGGRAHTTTIEGFNLLWGLHKRQEIVNRRFCRLSSTG